MARFMAAWSASARLITSKPRLRNVWVMSFIFIDWVSQPAKLNIFAVSNDQSDTCHRHRERTRAKRRAMQREQAQLDKFPGVTGSPGSRSENPN